MGLPLSRAVHVLRALLVLSVLAAAPAHADTWSARDVEAAERYRADERARAERYRAALENASRGAEEAREPARATRGGGPPGRAGLAERLSDWLGARIAGFFTDLLAAFEDWIARQLEALGALFEEPPPRAELRRAERAGEPLGDWLARERERARRLLDGLEESGAPRREPAAEREWAKREAEQRREWAKREAERSREWEKRRAEREREAAPAPWEARWREAESWERIERDRERIERERARRQLEAARDWQAEERERLEGR